jgi:hypothetical protein
MTIVKERECRPDVAADVETLHATSLRSLQQVIRDLEQLPAETEQGFLQVGARLHELCFRLNEIAEKSATAATLMSGGELLAIIAGLRNSLDQMECHAAAANEKAELAAIRFGRIRDGLDGVRRHMANFQEQVSTLRMMKTLTTIQSASLGGVGWGFRDVAADIGKLSQNVQAKSTGVILETRKLNADLERALQMASGLDKKQKNLARVVVETIRYGIGSLAAMHERCAATAAGVSGRSGEISREVSEVVVAMQFHDITRQQMQHAREALADAAAALRNGHGIQAAGAAGRDPLAEAGAVCELQAAQLTNTVLELTAAVTRMTGNLRTISGNAADASARVHELFGLADRVGRSSMDGIEGGLATVVAVFAENVATSRELTKVMASVTGAMGEIAAFLEDIDYIGSEIKLIALNASIKAAQAGSDGAALNVIAQTVKRQSEDICRQVAVITDTILRITGYLAELQEEHGDGVATSAREAEMEAMSSDLGSFVTALATLNDTVMTLLTDTDRAAANLAGEVEAAITAIQEQDGAKLLHDDIIPRLTMLVMSVRAVQRNQCAQGAREGMAAVELRYTMRSERNVHATFVSSADQGGGLPFGHLTGGALPGYGEHELGDNVEFF